MPEKRSKTSDTKVDPIEKLKSDIRAEFAGNSTPDHVMGRLSVVAREIPLPGAAGIALLRDLYTIAQQIALEKGRDSLGLQLGLQIQGLDQALAIATRPVIEEVPEQPKAQTQTRRTGA